jgi:hypothetical protein
VLQNSESISSIIFRDFKDWAKLVLSASIAVVVSNQVSFVLKNLSTVVTLRILLMEFLDVVSQPIVAVKVFITK